MKIDNCIKVFIETYDQEAIASIDKLSKNIGISEYQKVKLFNIQECFDKFIEFIDGYVQYKIENVDNPDATPHDSICIHTNDFINKLITEKVVYYKESNNFVQSYLEGVQKVESHINDWKTSLFKSEVDNASIGSINDFVEAFIENVDSHINPCMEHLLRASGYTTHKNIHTRAPRPLSESVKFI